MEIVFFVECQYLLAHITLIGVEFDDLNVNLSWFLESNVTSAMPIQTSQIHIPIDMLLPTP